MNALLLALVLSASKAGPPPPVPPPEPPPLVSVAGGTWSVIGALTAPQGVNVVEAGIGWPGLHVGYLRGISPQLELGVRFSFNYGFEGLVVSLVPGVKLQFMVRFKFFDNGKISFAAHVDPGPLAYFYPSNGRITCTTDPFGNIVCGRGNTAAGFTMPFGVRLGIAASSAVNVAVSFDMPLWFTFGQNPVVYIPLLMGVGAEYFLQSNLLLSFNVKMGPTLSSGRGTAVFTFESKLGVGYRF